jgi:hypothetical protein
MAKKKGWESKCQFDSQPLKVGNRLDLLAYMWCAKYNFKSINERYNFAFDLISIEGLHKKLWAYKVVGVAISRISGLPTWKSWDIMTFECSPCG